MCVVLQCKIPNISGQSVCKKHLHLMSTDKIVNRCVECNVDMGDENPRQLCGKTYCYEQDLED